MRLCSRRRFLAGSAACLGGARASAATATTLSAGVAATKVTPPLEIRYLASSGAGTNAPFQGVHDDLLARALVLDDGRMPLAIVAVDSLGYDNAVLGPGRSFTGELRHRVAAATGLEPGSVMLAASHTHSAPETIGLTPFRETPGASQWLQRHLEGLAETVIVAWKCRQPVRIRCGSVEVRGIERNRRVALKGGGESRRGPLPAASDVATPWQLDERLQVLYLESADGRPHSVVLNYTAHPVVAMGLPLVSADYPGAAAALVERGLGGATCLFTNGCAGNINPIAVGTNFGDVEAIGRRLGEAALERVERLKSDPALTDTNLAALSETCELASRPCPPLAEARRAAEAHPTSANGRQLRLAQKLDEGPIRAEVQVMAVGPIRWVALPGEPFVETGLALRQAGAAFVVGYANGYIGYLPIRRAYDEGGYEVDPGPWSRVAPGSAERLQSMAETLLGRIAVSHS
jgi:hypothetical protein